MLFGEMSDRSRRADMVNAAKNVCLDMATGMPRRSVSILKVGP